VSEAPSPRRTSTNTTGRESKHLRVRNQPCCVCLHWNVCVQTLVASAAHVARGMRKNDDMRLAYIHSILTLLSGA
jgi:hypothetical protein